MENEDARIACFQFTSNRIQVIASIEVLKSYVHKFHSLDYFWLVNSTKYPSKMSQHSYSFILRRYPKFLKKILTSIGFPNTKLLNHIPYSQDQFNQAYLNLSDQIKSLETIQEFSKLDFNGIKPGAALANLLAFEFQSQEIELRKIYPQIQLMLRSYLEIYFKSIDYLDKNPCLHVVIYNGRFLHERAVWDACSLKGIDVTIFETTRDRFHMRENMGFHNRVINQNLMISHWETSSIPTEKKRHLGSLYFEALQSGKNLHFTKHDIPKTIPSKYLVFFSNSDDEAVGFWDSWSSSGFSQLEVIKFMSEQLVKTDYSLIIRIHPNLKTKPKTEQIKWEEIKGLNSSLVIDQFSSISSYILLKGASGVVSFGSTIGLEAAYHNIPSLVLADCWYDLLGAVDKAYSLDEIINWVNHLPLDSNELMIRKQKAMICGFWLETAGKPIQNSVMLETGWGAWDVLSYSGVKVKPPRYIDLFHIIQNRIARKLVRLPRK